MAAPSSFVTEWVARLAVGLPPSPRALDLAMGSGRHVSALARAGFRVFGVDISWDAVRTAVREARSGGHALAAFCADMTAHPLPSGWFDLVLVTRYLDRPRFDAITRAVRPGGYIVYETFTTRQRDLGRGPTSADHLLEPGELAHRFARFDLMCSEETTAPEALARVVARRPPGAEVRRS